MKKDISSRVKSMLVVITMLLTALTAVITVSSTTVTNTGAVSSNPVPGATYVLVMDFTLTDNGTDILLNGTLPAAGTILAAVGEPADWGADISITGNLSYYDKVDGDSWNPTVDCIFNDTNENNKWNTGEPILAGNQSMINATDQSGPGVRDSDWTGIVTYDATDSDFWDSSSDAIIYEPDANCAYQDSLASITLNNDGTADDANISSLVLWVEDGATSGFQSDEDTNLGQITTLGDSISNIYQIIGSSGQRFYVTANLSGVAFGGQTLLINATTVSLNSTDDPDYIVNANTQTIGKLGVDYFEGTEQGAVDVITTDTKNLKYGATKDIRVDTSKLTNGEIYYLYRPYYKRTGVGGAYTYELQWKPYYYTGTSQASVTADGTNKTFQAAILLNYCGMWVLDNDNNPSDASNGTDTDFAYFWVNNSTPYSMELSKDEVYYGKNETVTITVRENGTTVEAYIDIVVSDNGTRIFHTWESDGTFSFNSDWLHNLSWAGNYTIKAYNDLDDTRIGYGIYGYSDDYGYSSPPITGINYSALCGPWDPFEKNATSKTLRVETGEPIAKAVAGNDTMYWGFPGEVNISIKGYDGKNLAGADAALIIDVYNESGGNVSGSIGSINNHISDGYILISDDSWDHGDNGTWYAYIYKNKDGDSGAKEYTEEWNTTVEWTVTGAPGLQFKWIDDDGVISDDNNDGVIPEVPDFGQQPLDIQFQLINETHDHYGDVDETAAKKNITVSGDALFVGSLDELPGVTYSGGTWTVPLIPLMKLNGGEITISANWEDSGSVTETLTIGGTKLNGSIVTISPSEFVIDENVTLTVTVKGPTGYPYPNALVELYWVNDSGGLQGLIDSTTTGNNAGEYTFLFNKTQQTENQTLAGNPWVGGDIKAPRNISAYVNLSNVGCGYALARMKPQSDLEVEISKDVVMAGEKTSFYVNVNIVGTNGTEQPVVDSSNPLQVAIYNTTGDRMTLDASFGSIRNTDLDDTNNSIDEYFLKSGIYTLYAYNNTHDSEGHNATFEIKAVEVICDKAPFIWSVDANISATFTITYNGNPVNGTLRIDNMSDVGAYNKTWTNCSFDGVSSHPGGNTSLLISKTKIINGTVTVHDITADALTENKSKQNITFWFKSTESGSVFAKATAQMTVEVPSVTPDPMYIPLGRTTKVYCTATGRGETLSDVFIRLHGQGFDQNSTTDVDGRAAFSITPASTGNISIDVGETGRTLTDTVVYVVAWIIDVENVAEVDEGEQFTVTVTKEGTTDVVVDATVTIKGIGTATTGSNGQVNFTAPEVTSDRTYTIKVTAEGYAPDPDTNTITVINTPKLILVIPDKVQATTTFNVAVADDTGGPIIGAIITFNEKTYTTSANGIAKLTAPKTKGDYLIEATFGTYVAATDIVTVTDTPGIPGFELLTLIAAIGVAFILLRRRRR